MKSDNEDEAEMPGQQKEPVASMAFVIFTHVKIIFQGIEKTPPDMPWSRLFPPFLLLVV
jgi:hypothetical protein